MHGFIFWLLFSFKAKFVDLNIQHGLKNQTCICVLWFIQDERVTVTDRNELKLTFDGKTMGRCFQQDQLPGTGRLSFH